jgi:hypothetical protein
MAERKVQKVARGASAQQSIGTCTCGGALVWAKVILRHPHMMKVCEHCDATQAR